MLIGAAAITLYACALLLYNSQPGGLATKVASPACVITTIISWPFKVFCPSVVFVNVPLTFRYLVGFFI